MPRYLIQRNLEGAASIPIFELNSVGRSSEDVLASMRQEGKDIQQEESFVVDDAVYCVYKAENESQIYEHAERAGVPVTKINQVTSVIRHNTSIVS